jgi:hypothetical protein
MIFFFIRLAKQMRILYDKGFSKEDRTAYKRFINLNVILSMRSLLMGMKETGAEIHPDHAQILDLLISHSSLLEQVILFLAVSAIPPLLTFV